MVFFDHYMSYYGIIFFNGLGDAIARSYSVIRVDARIIMPEPTYSTHFMAEVAHASLP